MRLLLDTHIFLWSLLTPERLGPEIALKLESPENELWLSPISVWETHLLAEKERVLLKPDPAQWIRSALQKVGFKEAHLNNEIALLSRSIHLSHQDPADRFLAATAVTYGLTLVTADARLLEAKGVETLPNL